MRLRFLELPEAVAPLVERHGLPAIEVERKMSVFRWEVSPNLGSSLPGSTQDRGLILARVESEESLDDCVSEIAALEQALRGIGRSAELIIASCGEGLNEFCGLDLQRARAGVRRGRLSWIAVNEFKASSPSLEELASVFERDLDGVILDPDGTEQILKLGDGEIAMTTTTSIWDEPVKWETLRPHLKAAGA
jgi:hypothetical protein